MQSVIKLAVFKFDDRFYWDCFLQPTAFSPFMAVISLYKTVA
jgi:hypothetical protein